MPFLRIFFIAFTLFGLSAIASAHEGRPVYIEVNEKVAGQYEIRWKIPPVVAAGSEPMIRLSGSGCKLIAGQPRPSLIGTHYYHCEGESTDLKIDLKYPGTNPVLSTLVLYRTLDGNEQSLMASPDESTVPLPGTETAWQVAQRYSAAGVEHILEGYDHLLFVLCLMLLSGTLKRMLITVTGFTLGHSLTLGMAALANWSLPPIFVEPLIAFSILILAAEVAKNKGNTLAFKFPAAVATGFGLLHGFGFGGALAEIGLPYGLQLQALAFFNIGVEIGQILFVVVAFSIYMLVKNGLATLKSGLNAPLLKPLAIYPAGLIAGYWTLERLIGIWQ